jgi:hypothetical protein
MKNRILIIVSLLALLCLMSACSTDKPDPAVGTWTLTSLIMGGTTLSGPLLAAAGCSMTLVVRDNNTYSISGTLFGSSAAATGTWSLSGSSYTFTRDNSGSAGIATLSGNTLSVSDSSMTLVFTRS